MFGAVELARSLAAIAANTARAADEAARARESLERLIKQHFGDRLKSAPFGPIFGRALLSPGATIAPLVTVTPPQSQAGILTGWALSACSQSSSQGEGWASSPISADGVVVDLLRGGAPVPNVSPIISPPGPIGQPGPIWLPFYPDQPIVLNARNTSGAISIEVCAQLVGFFDDTYLGRRG